MDFLLSCWINKFFQECVSGALTIIVAPILFDTPDVSMMLSLVIWMMMQGNYFVSTMILKSAPSVLYKIILIIICILTKMICNTYSSFPIINNISFEKKMINLQLCLFVIIIVIIRALSVVFIEWSLTLVDNINDSLSRLIYSKEIMTATIISIIIIPIAILYHYELGRQLYGLYISSALVILIPTGSLYGNRVFTLLHCLAMIVMIIVTILRVLLCKSSSLSEYIMTINMICYLIGFSTVCNNNINTNIVNNTPAPKVKKSEGSEHLMKHKEDLKSATSQDLINSNKIRVKNELKAFVSIIELVLFEVWFRERDLLFKVC
jgi:hypothetical protein